jgi:hypothetical protein
MSKFVVGTKTFGITGLFEDGLFPEWNIIEPTTLNTVNANDVGVYKIKYSGFRLIGSQVSW